MEVELEGNDHGPNGTSGIREISSHLKRLYQEKETWRKLYPDKCDLLPKHFSKEDWVMDPVLTANFDIDKIRQPQAESKPDHEDESYITLSWDDLDQLFDFLTQKQDHMKNTSDQSTELEFLTEKKNHTKNETGNSQKFEPLAERKGHTEEKESAQSENTEFLIEDEDYPKGETDHSKQYDVVTEETGHTENKTDNIQKAEGKDHTEGKTKQSDLTEDTGHTEGEAEHIENSETDHSKKPDCLTDQEDHAEGEVEHSTKTDFQTEQEHHTKTKSQTDTVKKSKFLQIQGDPGVGKSAALRFFALTWSKEESDGLNNYSALFVVPILQVETHSSLIDILGETQLGLVPSSEEASFEEYLSMHSYASKVVFLIDNIGDKHIPNESDLGRLIQGTLYKDSTVIAFTRTHLEHLQLLKNTQPLVKFTLAGMEDNSMLDFIEIFFKEHTAAEVTNITESLMRNLHDFDLMMYPFTLALVCSIIAKNKTNKTGNIKIPQNMGPLYKEFCYQLLKQWPHLDVDEETDVEFEKSPLEDESTIPLETQNLLYKCGQLCYRGLMSNKYEFSLTDLLKCQLQVSDIEKSSFFKIHQNGESTVIYARARQLQSYLAGLYLSYEGVHDEGFLSILENGRSRRAPLSYILEKHNLDHAVQLACGLSTNFLADLLPAVKRSTILLKNITSESVDIYYESSLYQETNDEGVLPSFQKYLLTSPLQMSSQTFFGEHFVLKVGKLGFIQYYHSCLKRTIAKFDQNICLPFLLKFYRLSVDGAFIRRVVVGDGGTLQLSSSDYLSLGLDQLQLEMLSRFQFLNVKALVVRSGSPAYFDIETLLRTMKGVRVIDIAATPIIPYRCNEIQESHELENSIAYLSLLSHLFKARFTNQADIAHIVSQEGLQHLFLQNVDILTEIGKLSTEPDFPCLSELHINSESNIDVALGCYSLLSSCRSTLKKLQLSFRKGARSNRPPYIIRTELQELRIEVPQQGQRVPQWTHGIPQKPFPLCIFHTENMADQMDEILTNLCEGSSVEEFGPSLHLNTVSFIAKCAMKMPKLKLLAVSSSNLLDSEIAITETLGHIPTLELFHIWKSEEDNYSFPKECEEILNRSGITVEIIIRKTPKSLDEYIQIAKLL